MPSTTRITIHSSQFPANVRRELVHSLRNGRVNHKFHYDSIKQTQKWLELHQAHSPSRNDPDCAAVYEQAFRAAAAQLDGCRVHLIGLGCGGGQKDTRLLNLLHTRAQRVSYSPCDVSTAMVLVARETALSAIPRLDVQPLVCDLSNADDLPEWFAKLDQPGTIRLITFFGMIPNFEPEAILPKLGALVRAGDLLLFGANLTPEPVLTGIQRVLPQYDNTLTREWLLTFLLDLGVERADGDLQFQVENHPALPALQRITAAFAFHRSRSFLVGAERFEFGPGDRIQLFFSYRYTAGLIHLLLKGAGVPVRHSFVTASNEEGVFLCWRD